MPQIFSAKFNTVARATSVAIPISLVALVWLGREWERSAYVTDVAVARQQPVPFSHRHHVGGLGIDCRYCHVSVETSSVASVPAVQVCMSCHSQLWTNADMLEPVRQSYLSEGGSEPRQPLRWVRVHDLPDFAYFDHSIHVNKGIGCVTCHGRVDEMPLLWKTQTLFMQWCLQCHRDPSPSLAPEPAVFNPAWSESDEGRHSQRDSAALAQKYNIHTRGLTDCVVCHR